ncbi:hypothetical protein [Alkalicella caledoniensis]|uniref:hypothetical protein n=1 Tax=Alkalicella caledoniensis TaxID=2731377 RepID=UPI001FE63454|nr:hypothetical protein [Alkalicella caledoniensis]
MGDKNNLKYNNSGYVDLTARDALEPMVKEEAAVEKKSNELVRIVKHIIALAGFELIGRVQIRHKKTGREFR